MARLPPLRFVASSPGGLEVTGYELLTTTEQARTYHVSLADTGPGTMAATWITAMVDTDDERFSAMAATAILSRSDSGWRGVTEEEYFESLRVEHPNRGVVLRMEGPSVVLPYDTDIPPWDNPEVPQALRDALRDARAESASEEDLDAIDAALRATSPHDEDQSGCSSGEPPSALFLLLAGLFAVTWVSRRRCTAMLVVAVALPAVAETTVHAKTVAGFAQFWDHRGPKTTATGTRLPWCDTFDTQCLPIDSDCCFEGLPLIRVEIEQENVVLASTITDSNGLYVLEDIDGDDTKSYKFIFTFEYQGQTLFDGSPGHLVSTPYGAPSTPYVYVKKMTIPGAFVFVNHTFDPPGPSPTTLGRIATAWRTTTDALYALVDEDVDHHFNEYGSYFPYDDIYLRYGMKRPPNCDTSTIHTYLDDAVSTLPASQMGEILQGRAAGCHAAYPSRAAFPPPPIEHERASPSRATSEGLAHGAAYGMVAAMLSRWDPQVAARADIESIQGITCAITTRDNANDLSWVHHNALAMWDLIDADTGSTDTHWDTTDLTFEAVVDGLVALKETPGSPGQNGTGAEPVYTGTDDQCSASIDECDPGDVCVFEAGSCYEGDPHGANLEDLVDKIVPVSGMYYTSTLMSSPCVGLPDNTYEFEGGFRND